MSASTSPGAYILTHTSTGLFYIGSASSLQNRFTQHRYQLRHGEHKSTRLQGAFNNDASISFMEYPCQDRNAAFDKEQQLLDQFAENPNMVNIAMNARSSNYGNTWSDEHKERLRQLNRGQVHSDETRAKISESRVGQCTPAQRAGLEKARAARAQIPVSDETKQKLSKSSKGTAKTNEHRANISEGLKGKKKSPEHTAKVQASRVGFKHTPESRARIAEKVRQTLAAKRAQVST